MQKITVAALALATPLCVQAEASPINKIVSMLTDLHAQITSEGEAAHKSYNELVESCEDRVRNLGFEIKTGTSEAESLTAAIAEEVASLSTLNTKVEELAASLASNDADLKAAGKIRKKEAADFAAEEKELVETIDMLGRATNILEREMNKGGAAMMQLQNAGSLVQTLDVMVQASMIATSDASRLTALLQQSQKSKDADDDEAPGAPSAAVYESQSGGIVDTLQDLAEKAEAQLAELRKSEVTSRHEYEMLKQSLEDEVKFGEEDMDAAKKGISESTERKATAEGDLDVTSKELSEDKNAKAEVSQQCEAAAATYASESKSRTEELAVLAQAKKVVVEATGGSAAAAFIQVASSRDLHRYEAVRLVRDLARKEGSAALAQLASRMTTAMQSRGAFDKVKALISDMIARLEKEAGADATKKAYCDKELKESTAKKSEKTDEIEKISTRIDRMAASSAQLKEEVATLENELSLLAKTQAEMDKLRGEQKAEYEASKAELEKGITGIKLALKILNEYYAADSAHESSEGAASGIIALLETVEADFSKNLAQISADEESAAAAYEAETKENEIDRTAKDQSVKYKVKESKALDKSSAELTSDRNGVQAELDAVSEYLTKIEGACVEKAESYAERAERRAAEIAGLKEALNILESETALVQQQARHRTLRGARHVALKA